MAHLSQVSTTSQRRQTAFASSIWRSAGSLFPSGKNSSGSTSRQAAQSRHVIRIGLLESRTSVSITRVNARGASGGGGCPWLTQGQRSQRPGRLPSQRQPQQARRRTRQPVTTRDAINPGGYSDLLFRSNFQEERPNVSTGDLPQVQQRDVVWLRPACQPSDGRRAEVQALPVPPQGLLRRADLRRPQVICLTG
jgi:hypothetical protein